MTEIEMMLAVLTSPQQPVPDALTKDILFTAAPDGKIGDFYNAPGPIVKN
jgi:hypothetical protein